MVLVAQEYEVRGVMGAHLAVWDEVVILIKREPTDDPSKCATPTDLALDWLGNGRALLRHRPEVTVSSRRAHGQPAPPHPLRRALGTETVRRPAPPALSRAGDSRVGGRKRRRGTRSRRPAAPLSPLLRRAGREAAARWP